MIGGIRIHASLDAACLAPGPASSPGKARDDAAATTSASASGKIAAECSEAVAVRSLCRERDQKNMIGLHRPS